MKIGLKCTTFIFLLFFNPFPLFAQTQPEEELTRVKERLQAFNQSLTLREIKVLNETHPSEKGRLIPSLRRLYEDREELKKETDYWGHVVRLKKDLLALPTRVNGERSPFEMNDQRVSEADRIAQTAINGFNELRKEYEMIRPALFHNLLVNMKIKEGGLCWQWARDMIKRLKTLDLKEYDLHWASAREGTIREHNTVVISSRGMPLEEGLFLDGWKHSGKPFWMRVKADKKHPWKPGRPYGIEM